jgi:hypothetical protein
MSVWNWLFGPNSLFGKRNPSPTPPPQPNPSIVPFRAVAIVTPGYPGSKVALTKSATPPAADDRMWITTNADGYALFPLVPGGDLPAYVHVQETDQFDAYDQAARQS